ncbi:MAG: UPF0280 family protein [Proteobacteria bacterium]|nr:UPF0280 family protein [Pseudomonadota bacterium]MBU4297892.1 UPF0280 family protein [Pseudomonadota bacterium]MCG2746012.1 UPF0280 family protein [Desulfobulbaceae bacterium]
MKSKRKRKNPDPLSYRQRDYRGIIAPKAMTRCHVSILETDLLILANSDVTTQAAHLVMQYRSHLETYISRHTDFLTSLVPLDKDPLAPPIVKEMLNAATLTGVGPMAAVAGAIAEFVGRDLLKTVTDEIIIENGGDIFMHRHQDSIAAIFAGASPLSNKIGIKIPKSFMPLGICTSSGTIGHSLSFGQADSVTVLAASASVADAAATRLGNELTKKTDMNHALAVARNLSGLRGVVIVKDDHLGVWGDIELAPLHG